MQICKSIEDVRRVVDAARAGGREIGFVPTMGALHAGHVSLIDAARADGTWPVVSIFVNPTQFGPHEDFSRYPRDEVGDLEKCRNAGTQLVFLPPVEVMYRAEAKTTVRVAKLADTLCGPHRPGHFDGVATVVSKLFHIVQPDVAYFGQKDAQQLAVIRRMVIDLDFPIRIVGVPTMREPDGLAMSSRNAYLSADERRRARCINRALRAAERLVGEGETRVTEILTTMERIIAESAPERIDYVSVVDADTMQSVDRIDRAALIAVALYIGKTRLIDNVMVAATR
ncbi:MAG: pantoate--beta-alanine ligase [Phycisphaerae bacterium]